MNEECKNCIQVKSLEDKIKSLWHEAEESREQRKDIEKRVVELERKSDVTEEKFDRIFTAIEAIEKNVEKIADGIDQIRMKDSETYSSLKLEAIKYVVIAVIAFAVAKFIK